MLVPQTFKYCYFSQRWYEHLKTFFHTAELFCCPSIPFLLTTVAVVVTRIIFVNKCQALLLFLLVILISKYFCHMATYSRKFTHWKLSYVTKSQFLKNWKNFLSMICKFTYFTLRKSYRTLHSYDILSWLISQLVSILVDPLSLSNHQSWPNLYLS